MAIEQEKGKWGPHPPIMHSGRDIEGPGGRSPKWTKMCCGDDSSEPVCLFFPTSAARARTGHSAVFTQLPPVRLVCRALRALARRDL